MNIIIPNLRHLRAFREVATLQSVSAASRSIFLSQPAITQAISKLEILLGASLFDRRSNGMFVTPIGEMFLNRVNRCLDLLKQGAKEACRQSTKPHTLHFGQIEHQFTATQLRALIAVANARNFTLAAKVAGVSQPSLHRAARDLENALDLQLFDKTTNGIRLTHAAEILVQSVMLAFSEIKQGYAEVNASLGLETGSIVIGSMPLVRTELLPTVIEEFVKEFPRAMISVIDGPYDDLLRHLRHGEVDMLLGALRTPKPTIDVIQEKLFVSELVIVARKGHPLANKEQLQVIDLIEYGWAVPCEGTPTRDHFDMLFSDAGIDHPDQIVESSSLVLINGLLQKSDRLTVISSHQVFHGKERGHLVSLPIKLPNSNRSIGITMRQDWQPTEMQRAFITLVRRWAVECSQL